jgi:hypothetical protein
MGLLSFRGMFFFFVFLGSHVTVLVGRTTNTVFFLVVGRTIAVLLHAFHFETELGTIAHKEFMIVGIVIIARDDSYKAPTIDLAHKRSVLGVTKMERNDDLFKHRWVEDAPGLTMGIPANAFLEFRVGEDLVQLQWE